MIDKTVKALIAKHNEENPGQECSGPTQRILIVAINAKYVAKRINKTENYINKQLSLQLSKIRGIIIQYTNMGLEKGEIGAPTSIHSSRIKAYQAAYMENPENREKKTAWQAAYRGIKESDELRGKISQGCLNSRVRSSLA